MDWSTCEKNGRKLNEAKYILKKIDKCPNNKKEEMLQEILCKSLITYHTMIMKHGSDRLKDALMEWNIQERDLKWDDAQKMFIYWEIEW